MRRRDATFDSVGVIEAAYRPAPSDDAWLTGLLEASRADLGTGLGLWGFTYDLSDPARRALSKPIGFGPDGWERAFAAVTTSYSLEAAARLTSAPVALSSEHLRGLDSDLEVTWRHIGPLGARDMLGVNAGDPTGRGCILTALLPSVGRLGRDRALTWSRLAAHIAAGLRLRHARRDAPTAAAAVDAVLTPKGRVEHAVGDARHASAREALRAAAVAVTRATTALRRTEPDQALSMWRALVAGRWSLVDHFDSDGKRYVVARRNDPRGAVAKPLTLRECQVIGYAGLGHTNKLIAYELGLSESTVASHLRAAAAKLGVASRAALIRAARGSP